MRRIVVLGSTGSIGTQTLDVARRFPNELQIVGLAAHSNRRLLHQQAEEFAVSQTSLFQEDGEPGLDRLATLPEADLIVVAVAGVVGLSPTLAALQQGKRIALASKEVLVAGGEVVLAQAHEPILPIDSEHSAIFQCLNGLPPESVHRIVLTCSGGPFRGRSRKDLSDVTIEETLNHPTWSMGGKITVDSASLMNKALEMIEAKWLFNLAPEQIDVVVHPESVIHSMVEVTDGSFLAQLGQPDMRVPISVALFHPDRAPDSVKPRWDPFQSPPLTFEPVDEETFPVLELARRAMRVGGTLPAVLNAADEVLANGFLRGEISFLGITEAVASVMDKHDARAATLENILAADAEARVAAQKLLN